MTPSGVTDLSEGTTISKVESLFITRPLPRPSFIFTCFSVSRHFKTGTNDAEYEIHLHLYTLLLHILLMAKIIPS